MTMQLKMRSILAWTCGGAIFGVGFGALASIFQGGPDMIQGIQESWWWFAAAGFMIATIGNKSRPLEATRRTP
jgi:hypothetical protein